LGELVFQLAPIREPVKIEIGIKRDDIADTGLHGKHNQRSIAGVTLTFPLFFAFQEASLMPAWLRRFYLV
jgi:hypothetical protein